MKTWVALPADKKVIAVFLFALLIAGSAFMLLKPQSTSQSSAQIVTISRGDISTTVITTGVLKPVSKISVGAQVNGQLKKLYVKQGEAVKQGQLLAEIDPILQQNELRKSEAELNSAKAQLRSAKVLLKQYQLTLQRQKKMIAEGSGVQSDLELAQSQFDTQNEQLSVNQAQIVQSEMAVETARANVGYTRILSPIDGEVLGIVTQEGQTIVSSQTAPTIMVIADLSTMRIHTRISETDILKVKPGQPLEFYVVADPTARFKSVMGEIQNAPDDVLKESSDSPAGGSQAATAIYYNGFFDVANDKRLLKTSMTVQVFIVVNEAKHILRVPLSALGEKGADGRYSVSVVPERQQDAALSKTTQVELGIRDAEYAEVKSGLAPGDRVVLASHG